MTEDFYKEIGEKIRELREKSNLTQGFVSEKAGIYQTELSALEKYGTKIKGADKINKILDVLGYELGIQEKKTSLNCA